MSEKYEFTKEDLKTWFTDDELNRLGIELIVREICEMKKLDFNKCIDIRVENKDFYAPKLIFEYV